MSHGPVTAHFTCDNRARWPSESQPSHETVRYNPLLEHVFETVFIPTILAVVVFIPNPTAIQYHCFAIVMSLAAGGFATVITGIVDVLARFGKRPIVGATCALGVYFFLPGDSSREASTRDAAAGGYSAGLA